MNILVVGGAGYIGSHMVQVLLDQGYAVTTFDNLSTGFRDTVIGGTFIEGDLTNKDQLDTLFSSHPFDCVMHFAALSQVGESVTSPDLYYQNNISGTLNLLDAMVKHNVKNIIFSSTAALFGNPQYSPIDEKHPTLPINPYGHSKLMVEQILEDYRKAYGLQYISLRYFNAAGASPDGSLGERHNPETHLIPIILQVAMGQRDHIKIYGTDYKTPDGTCIRDYVHVIDLCQAHLLSMKYLMDGNPSDVFNLGNHQGYSVLEIIKMVEQVTKHNIHALPSTRRRGDPDMLVSDSAKINQTLDWKPDYPDIKTIIEHAWLWATQSASSSRKP